MTPRLHLPTPYRAQQSHSSGEASGQSLALAAEPRVIPGSPRGVRAAVNPFSQPKRAGGEVAAPPSGGRRGWGPVIKSPSRYKPRGCGSALRAPRGAVVPRGCGSRCPACGGSLSPAVPGSRRRRHGVVRGFSQLSFRVRYPPYRADPEPQSGAHQPRGAARHPRLRDRVSGRGEWTPTCVPSPPGCGWGKPAAPPRL